jgi:hypothetical protein
MTIKSLLYAVLAVLMLVAVWYCLYGFAMAFDLQLSTAAYVYSVGAVLSVILFVAFARAPWRSRRAR